LGGGAWGLGGVGVRGEEALKTTTKKKTKNPQQQQKQKNNKQKWKVTVGMHELRTGGKVLWSLGGLESSNWMGIGLR